jgi:hypothetical protein
MPLTRSLIVAGETVCSYPLCWWNACRLKHSRSMDFSDTYKATFMTFKTMGIHIDGPQNHATSHCDSEDHEDSQLGLSKPREFTLTTLKNMGLHITTLKTMGIHIDSRYPQQATEQPTARLCH